MLLRSKHANVIIYSSIVIAVVMVSTLVGYTLYIQWKEDSFALRYRNSIYKLTAAMFKAEILLSNVSIKRWEEAPYGDVPVFEGSIKNNSSKALTSITVEISFRKPDGTVVYKSWVHPLGEKLSSVRTSLPAMGHARSVLLPGEGMSFAQILKNCPKEMLQSLPRKSKFAKGTPKSDITAEYAIVGVSVL